MVTARDGIVSERELKTNRLRETLKPKLAVSRPTIDFDRFLSSLVHRHAGRFQITKPKNTRVFGRVLDSE